MEVALKELRIAFVSRYPPVHCGVGEYTRMLAGALKGISPDSRVIVYSTYEAGTEPYYDNAGGVEVKPSYDRLANDYSSLLNTITEDGGVDVIHVQHEYGIQGPHPELIDALLEAKRERLVRVAAITMHTVVHPLSGRSDALKFQGLIGELDLVIVHSHLQEYELQVQGVKPNRLYRVPHGTLINEYIGHPRHKLLKSLEAELGLRLDAAKGLTLAVPGFLRRDKGLDVLVEALRMLEPGQVTVVVAGEVWESEAARELDQAQGVIRVNRYLSHDQILKLAAAADAVVLPYRDKKGAYAVSGVLHLSMGSLKPIVGTRVPRLVELHQLAPGLTVPPRDPEALAGMLKWLRANYDVAATYMSEVYAYAARTQWPSVARRHITLYRALLSGKRPISMGSPGPGE